MRIQRGLPRDKRSKLKSPGSKVQVLYTCTGQWVPRTIGNYGHRNRRENNSVQDNSDMGTMGVIVLRGQRTGYNATEDNGDDTGSKLSRKGNGSTRIGAKRAVHDRLNPQPPSEPAHQESK